MHVNPDIARFLEGMNNPSLPGIDLSLVRMEQLLAVLGHPEKKLPLTVHVAGTNGKGSTIAYLRAIYEAAGYLVHAYISPHLVRFNERIVLAGEEISDAALLGYLQRIQQAARDIPVTFFEATTAAAFLAFSEVPADVLLLEVGLGGRLDATNLASPVAASVITPIGIDHAEFLGNSLAAIAGEKAGIMRADTPCVTAVQESEVADVLQAKADMVGARLISVQAQALPVPSLPGAHQHANAALAATVVSVLRPQLPVNSEAINHGITHARWPARLQRLTYGPLVDAWPGPVLLDGGHNPHAARAVAAALAGQPVVMIAGMMARKDAEGFFAPFRGVVAQMVCIPVPNAPDSYNAEDLARAAQHAGIPAQAAETLADALQRLAPVGNATLLVGGSLYLAGEILKTHG